MTRPLTVWSTILPRARRSRPRSKLMAVLEVDRIRLQATAVDKEDAIRQAGELLVRSGCVAEPYVQGMLAREQTMSTYLGNGVAIPHGEFDDRAYIHKTGISVLQLTEGIEWEEGELAYLIIGIAAQADEHVSVLDRKSVV